MTLRSRELRLAPNALELARCLEGEHDLAFLWSADGSGPSFIALGPWAQSAALDPEPTFGGVTAHGELARVPRWIGLLPYEARRSLERPGQSTAPERRAAPHLTRPLWLRCGAVLCVDERVTVVGDEPARVDELCSRLASAVARRREPCTVAPCALEPCAGEPLERHVERVRRALQLIGAGEIYQVNLARRLDFRVSGSSVELLAHACRAQRPPYAAALRVGELSVVCTSPELLLAQRRDGLITTRPIKGTRPRGSDAASDARLAAELAADPKEHAELSMVIDVERNDLGRVSALGSVRVQPANVRAYGPVWNRAATVLGRLRSDVTRSELLQAMLPSGSVTGAPKIRAMEIIASLEAERRGLYTGALGYLNHRGELLLAMAIRTLTVKAGVGHYFAGGGIVADSQPDLELRETEWKARQLFGRAV
jgi:anthranilate/para-aminobenzoate synthase component I